MPGLPDTEPDPDFPLGPRFALIIATATHTDSRLRELPAPVQDAKDLAAVLGDPAIGGFSVTSVVDQTAQMVRTSMDDFLSGRSTRDLVLVYLSCHGLLDPYRRLFFAATDTRKDRLQSTGVEAAWILDLLEHCRARRQILILDSCFSGAFAHGAKGDTDVRLQDRFAGQGRGRVVLTASTATEYSFEGTPTQEAPVPPSVFTAALVEGMLTGNADLDHDGYITVDDVYSYTFDRVQAAGAAQTPQRWFYGAEGQIVLARNASGRSANNDPLPESLRKSLKSPFMDTRITAIDELRVWARGGDLTRVVTARHYLRQIADSDIPPVAGVARDVLEYGVPYDSGAIQLGGAEEYRAGDSADLVVRRQASSTSSRQDAGMPSRLSLTVSNPEATEVTTTAFSADGLLVACSFRLDRPRYGAIWIVESATGHQLRRMEGLLHCTSIAFSPDGSALATTHQDGTRIWDLATGKLLHYIEGHSHFSAVAFSRDGKRLVASENETIKTIDMANGKICSSFRAALPGGPVAALKRVAGRRAYLHATVLSSDGRLLAAGYSDGSVQVWETGAGVLNGSFRSKSEERHLRHVEPLAFSPDGARLLVVEEGQMCSWDLSTGQQINFTGKWSGIRAATFDPLGRVIAGGVYGGAIKICNPLTGESLSSLGDVSRKNFGQNTSVTAIAFSTDGGRLAVGKYNYNISPELMRQMHGVAPHPGDADAGEQHTRLEIWE
jgi:hypothetical protein